MTSDSIPSEQMPSQEETITCALSADAEDKLLASEPDAIQALPAVQGFVATSTALQTSESESKLSWTGMMRSFSLWMRLIWLRIFARVLYEPTQVQEILAIPADESIVYLIQNENRYDFLYLNYLCLKTGLPLAYASNGKSYLRFASLGIFLRALLGTKAKKSQRTQVLLDAVRAHQPILLFLRQGAWNETEKQAETVALLDKIDALVLENSQRKIHYIPIGTIWERRSESSKQSLLSDIYGTPSRPSSFRRFWSVIPSLIQVFFKIGKPLCLLHHYVADAGQEQLAPGQRYAQLDDDIAVMHQQVNGPKIKAHQQLLKEIVSHPNFLAELSSLAQNSGQSRELLVKEARKILDKTAAKFSFLSAKVMMTLLTPMWTYIYNGLFVDGERFNQLRELSKTHRLVFIPSHKSHVDYLVLSVLLFQHGLMPPHIVAGENLNFKPVGSMLRRGGAFFIRRSFRGDQLYALCIRHYIYKLLQEGYPLEFFIEGGRSRTGQVLQPKYGILRMIAQAVSEDPSLKVKLIPCAITYEKVIEDIAYISEQGGGKKKKENIAGLLKTTRLLISKYGQLYVSFSEPVDLNEALCLEEEGLKVATAPIKEEEFAERVDGLARHLMYRINKISTITTSALSSLVLLNGRQAEMSFDEMKASAAFFLAILIERNALISPILKQGLAAVRATMRSHSPEQSQDNSALLPIETLKTQASLTPSQLTTLAETVHEPILEALKLFKNNGSIKQTGDPQNPRIQIETRARLQLTYYKNSLLFAIVDEIYLSAALLSLDGLVHEQEEIQRQFFAIAEFFNIEFADSFDFDAVLKIFEQRYWLERQEAKICLRGEAVPCLQMLARCFAHHVSSYLQVCEAIIEAEESFDEALLIEHLLEKTGRALDEDSLDYPESRSKAIYVHALEQLRERNYLSLTYDSSGRKAAKILTKTKVFDPEFEKLLSQLKRILSL